MSRINLPIPVEAEHSKRLSADACTSAPGRVRYLHQYSYPGSLGQQERGLRPVVQQGLWTGRDTEWSVVGDPYLAAETGSQWCKWQIINFGSASMSTEGLACPHVGS